MGCRGRLTHPPRSSGYPLHPPRRRHRPNRLERIAEVQDDVYCYEVGRSSVDKMLRSVEIDAD